jgi:hypothetical protein
VERGGFSVSADSDSDVGPLIFRREWDPGRTDEAQPHSRFLARGYPAGTNGLVLSLDTAINQLSKADAAIGYAKVDSIHVSGVQPDETFTDHCYLAGSDVIGQLGGVSNRGTPDHFEHPRLAWRFDTTAKRIRVIKADSVYCTIIEPD